MIKLLFAAWWMGTASTATLVSMTVYPSQSEHPYQTSTNDGCLLATSIEDLRVEETKREQVRLRRLLHVNGFRITSRNVTYWRNRRWSASYANMTVDKYAPTRLPLNVSVVVVQHDYDYSTIQLQLCPVN